MATSNRREAPSDRELKAERMELRLTRSAKDLIKRAMTVSGLAAGDLAYEGARRILDDHQRQVLSGADRDAFLNAVLNPREPTQALVEAVHRQRQRFG